MKNTRSQSYLKNSKKVATLATLAATVMLTVVPGTSLAANAAKPTQVKTATAVSQKLPAYLQGYRQGQLLCPGGSMTGKVSTAIVDPSVATTDAPGDCTLSDMKAANPDTKFLAYIDIAAMRPVEPWNGVFKNSCADPATPEGAKFAVTTSNAKVAKNQYGHATFPSFQYLSVANLSSDYVDSCVAVAKTILNTPSEKGITDAPAAKFDGIFLDDVSVSPSHGQDMVDVGQWGPWASDDAYGREMVAAVKQFDTQLEATMRKPISTAVNLGVYPAWTNQVTIAKELAATKTVDFALRELTVQSGNGTPLSVTDTKQATAANQAITAAGMPIVEHDYSVPLKEVPVSAYTTRGTGIDYNASCLGPNSADRDAIVSAALTRRTLDHRMTLGHTLLSRTSGTKAITATLSQAEPSCQANAWDDGKKFEPVTALSVNTNDSQVTALTTAINSGAYAVSVSEVNGVQTALLSNGQRVVVNPFNDTRTITVDSKSYTTPGHSATIM